jgi:hypothetical protein
MEGNQYFSIIGGVNRGGAHLSITTRQIFFTEITNSYITYNYSPKNAPSIALFFSPQVKSSFCHRNIFLTALIPQYFLSLLIYLRSSDRFLYIDTLEYIIWMSPQIHHPLLLHMFYVTEGEKEFTTACQH